jgi:hypothetical protein
MEVKKMTYCHKCEQEYEVADGCLCPVYRVLMRDGHYNSVPPFWIVNEWEEPLWCDNCKSSYAYGSPCYCDDEAAAIPA